MRSMAHSSHGRGRGRGRGCDSSTSGRGTAGSSSQPLGLEDIPERSDHAPIHEQTEEESGVRGSNIAGEVPENPDLRTFLDLPDITGSMLLGRLRYCSR